MKIFEILDSQEWLSKLIKLNLDIRAAFKLKKFILEVESKLKPFDLIREDLIKKYWEEKDWTYIVKQENIQIFNSEINKIINEEIEIEIPEIKVDDIKWNIDTATLLKLYYLIKE